MSKQERDDYYTPAEVMQFTADHIIWLVEVMQYYGPGEWPPTNGEKVEQGGYSNHAHFEAASLAMSELSWRLARTGPDGRKLKKQIADGVRDPQQLEFNPRQALFYCCGRCRKLLTYTEWRLKVLQNKYRNTII
jgi:hypothetical protein